MKIFLMLFGLVWLHSASACEHEKSSAKIDSDLNYILTTPHFTSGELSVSGVELDDALPKNSVTRIHTNKLAPEEKSTTRETSSNNQVGMRVFVDPDTGKITANPGEAQLRELNEIEANNPSLNQSDVGLVEYALPNGGIGKDLQGRFQSTMVMHVDANGKQTVVCDQPAHRNLDPILHDQAHAPVSNESNER